MGCKSQLGAYLNVSKQQTQITDTSIVAHRVTQSQRSQNRCIVFCYLPHQVVSCILSFLVLHRWVTAHVLQ